MIMRLQGALGCTGLTEQIVLLPHSTSIATHPDHEINLIVGYDSSPKSQTALDLTLWIAHQTRLVHRNPVTVQVVYVINPDQPIAEVPTAGPAYRETTRQGVMSGTSQTLPRHSGALLQEPARLNWVEPDFERSLAFPLEPSHPSQAFEQADRILWQARCLANEWRGSLKTHLRFGNLVDELRSVVQAESATLLWLGCESAHHPVVQALGPEFPCPVLGIPPALHPDRFFE